VSESTFGPPARVAALIPAAGASRRMGRDKRRLPLGESTVLEQTISRLRAGGLAPIVVVLEADSPCRELLAAQLERGELIVAENPHPERGMLSTIRCGLEALEALEAGAGKERERGEIAAVAVQPGDHPFVPPSAVQALLELFTSERPPLLVPRYPQSGPSGRKRGHPLFIRRDLWAEAAACDDEVGLRQLLGRRRGQLRALELELAGADDDLDTPEDYARLIGSPRRD
jgi:molybdenum cofactor cytidylyltransferase